MRALAITGMVTAEMMPSIMSGSLIRDTPPWARMSAGTRSSAITATAPAPSAMRACSGVTTSMMTPPLSISAMPRLTRAVPVRPLPFGEAAVLTADLLQLMSAQSNGGPGQDVPTLECAAGRTLGVERAAGRKLGELDRRAQRMDCSAGGRLTARWSASVVASASSSDS